MPKQAVRIGIDIGRYVNGTQIAESLNIRHSWLSLQVFWNRSNRPELSAEAAERIGVQVEASQQQQLVHQECAMQSRPQRR